MAPHWSVQRKENVHHGLKAGSVDYYYAHYSVHGSSLGIISLPGLIKTTNIKKLIYNFAFEHKKPVNEIKGALFYANNVNSLNQLTHIVRSGKQLKTIKGLGWTSGFQYRYYDRFKKDGDTTISGLSHFQKMKKAVSLSKIWPAIKKEFSNLKEFVLIMLLIAGIVFALSSTPVGPALALLLRFLGIGLAIKLLFDTILLLKDFYVITGSAATIADLNKAAQKFAQAAAKIVSIAAFIGLFKVLRKGANRLRIRRKIKLQAEKSGGLNISKTKAPSLKDPTVRKAFRGEPNSIIKGQDALRQGGGSRAFITDSQGKIIKEITPQRVKILEKTGRGYEVWKKLKRPLNSEELKILDMIKGD